MIAMKILVTGASGFVGTHLCRFLLNANHHVIGLARSEHHNRISHQNYRFLTADTTRPGPWQERLTEVDAVINLAGRSIFGRWNEGIKSEIRESRIMTTRNVVQGLPQGKATVLISASGVGYYGSRGDEVLTEDSRAGDDFLARLSVDWESEALAARPKGTRVVLMRLGVVLGRGGGAMAQMLPAFKAFVGGPIGDGRQWFPWIHLHDLAAAVLFLIQRPELNGPVNLCAPNPVPNRTLAEAIGKSLNRPAFMRTPAFMIRMALGEFADVLLGSQRVVPEKLLKQHFNFYYPEIEAAVNAIAQGEAA
jgi:hypothetical protein